MQLSEKVLPACAFRTFPTRFPSLAVDHIFVNAALHPTQLSVHRTPLARLASDHFPLVCPSTPFLAAIFGRAA